MVLGFRPFHAKSGWSIHRDDPTLWVRFCEGVEFSFSEFDFPSGDPLAGTTPDFNAVLQSVIDDINNISTSFVRVAWYPADPNNPPAPASGDSAFTIESAAHRTIDVCTGDSPGLSGGHAKLKGQAKRWTGCEIKLNNDTLKNAKQFVATFTHELGHCLGLAHPQETTHSVMSYFSGDLIRMQIDDKMGLSYLYPIENGFADEQATFGILGCDPR